MTNNKTSVKLSHQQKNKEGYRMSDKLINIDEKIHQLRKRREKVQTQQAIQFMREVQKIFQDGFSADMALGILSETWSTASETQKQNWRKRSNSFRPSSTQNNRKKPQAPEPTHQQS